MDIFYTPARSLVNEIVDVFILQKNKNYTCSFEFWYVDQFNGIINIRLYVMNGLLIIDSSKTGVAGSAFELVVNTNVTGQILVESLMVDLVKQYLKI